MTTPIKADDTKTLKELGVQPGWFCQHGGCSIWFEITAVYDDWLLCVARDPKQRDTYVSHRGGWSGLWWLSETEPTGHVIKKVDEKRVKNFFDKFHPEAQAMTARGQVEQTRHHQFWGQK